MDRTSLKEHKTGIGGVSANQWVPRLPIILLKNVASGEPSSIPWRAKSILADRP